MDPIADLKALIAFEQQVIIFQKTVENSIQTILRSTFNGDLDTIRAGIDVTKKELLKYAEAQNRKEAAWLTDVQTGTNLSS